MDRGTSLLATGLLLAAVCAGSGLSARGPVTFQGGINLIQLDAVASLGVGRYLLAIDVQTGGENQTRQVRFAVK
jgi:hypothetical protein